jgi:Fur family ferric uptake transcriptional regulator
MVQPLLRENLSAFVLFPTDNPPLESPSITDNIFLLTRRWIFAIVIENQFKFCPEAGVKDVEQEFRGFLKSRGLRCTPERLAILREVMASDGHFEADHIFVRLHGKKARASQTSVFRTLNLLVEAGIVRKTPCDQMKARYEPVFGMHHHDHLVCMRCGRIIEFSDECIERLQQEVARKHNFALLGHRLILSGYCDRCA